ncbi:MAG: TonB family protein [Candidatus Omnitrophica bacterium]|nr:TonB family protein [Candidatus Omnitrophota bacterium]
MNRALLKKFFIILLGFVLTLLYLPLLSADENTSETEDVIDMVTGDIQSVTANSLTRVSVTNPDVADISDAQADKVSLVAKKPGTTVLFLWDEAGKRSIKVRVVSQDLESVKARIQKILDEAKFTGVSLDENRDEGKVAVSGSLSKEDKTRLEDILQPYAENLLNLVKVEKIEDLIQVDMQVVEISTTLERQLGIQWSNAAASNTSGGGTTPTTTGGSSSSGLSLPYNETPPQTNGKIGDFFKIGEFNRSFQLEATVNALLQEGKAKLISKPRLVVVSGKQASFLVGGEIPIQSTTTSASGGSQTQNTSYTQYGVNMTVTPTIRDGKIDVVLNVDIRDVDNSSSFSTNSNVAFITRTASTDLLMENKQTLALAGLIKYSSSETLTEVPFFSKIPVLGALFRNRSVPGDSNTEMVIILTPTVLTEKKILDKQLSMPTPSEKDAYKAFDAKYEHEPLPSWPVPKVTSPVSNTHADIGTITAYARMVQLRISQAISYPQPAGQDLAGTVKLKVHILNNGSLDSEEVVESSGNSLLDQDALQAAKTASPFNAFTTGIDQKDLFFTIPIVYNKFVAKGQGTTAEKVIASY